MSPVQLFALKHPMMVHFPIAAPLFLVPALLFAMREGEGTRPWGHAARYLAWAGLVSFLPPLISGFLWAKGIGLIPAGAWVAPSAPATQELEYLVRRHELVSLGGVLLGLATVWALSRGKDRPSALALSFACVWMVFTFATGYFGGKMTHPILTETESAAADPVPASSAPSPSVAISPSH